MRPSSRTDADAPPETPALSARRLGAIGLFWLCALLILWLAAPRTAVDAQAPTPAAEGTVFVAGCTELIANGGFEVERLAWEPLVPGLPPDLDHEYVTDPVFAGAQSLKLGIVDGPNTAITSGVYQTVFLPSTANPIVLGFHYLPRHGNDPGNDLQFLDIVDAISGERITRLWAQLVDREDWIFLQFDLTSLQGRTVRVEFGVTNDGAGGATALYIDAVTLLACDAGPLPSPTVTPTGPTPSPTTPTPTEPTPGPTLTWTSSPTALTTGTLTPTPTGFSPIATPTLTPRLSPTPLPEGCVLDVIANGSFEQPVHGSYGWIIGNDPVPPELVSDGYDGLRSLRLGNPPDLLHNVVTYSSVRQLITIPPSAVTARLLWAHESFTQEAPDVHPGRYQDRQELILLTPKLITKRILYRQLVNAQMWAEEVTDLTSFIGQTFYVYFNVFNDGDGLRTWMHLDAVRLEICYSVPPPTPTSTPFPTTTFTPTPIPTHEAAAPRTSGGTGTETPVPEVNIQVDELDLIVPTDAGIAEPGTEGESSESGQAPETETRSFFLAVGNFLSRNWQWAIPWALLAFLLMWRFLR